ncbi:MAG: Gfo/Idh/MocA family oxidoreductase [Acidobacteriia bacterium]|nr:Gfo/Idh/MocA family oxidoreductase [Terriglobia bacterium]
MNSKIRFGMVGTGRIAHAYAEAFRSSEVAELVAVADTREDAVRAFAEETRCQGYTRYEDLAKHPSLEAVVVCTPPVSHPEISTHFLERRVHVMCEKPVSIDIPSAKQMIETADRAGVLLTMASKFRYVSDVVQAKSIVASGVLGDIVQFENCFCAHVDMARRWNSDPAISGGGVLIDNGTHSVDILRYFLGPIAEINVVEGIREQNLQTEETVYVLTHNVNGVIGMLDLSWTISKSQASYIRVFGTQGSLSVGWTESRYRYNSSRHWFTFGSGYDKIQALRSQVENFARAIRGEEKLLVTSEDILASVEVIIAAYVSLRQKRWIPIQSAGVIKGDEEATRRLRVVP